MAGDDTTPDFAPGQYVLRSEPIPINLGRPRTRVSVKHTGDRPVQVGSHYHFFEVNAALVFDREVARGKRLDIPAGTAVRFEPGQEREVTLVPYAGRGRVIGFRTPSMDPGESGDGRG